MQRMSTDWTQFRQNLLVECENSRIRVWAKGRVSMYLPSITFLRLVEWNWKIYLGKLTIVRKSGWLDISNWTLWEIDFRKYVFWPASNNSNISVAPPPDIVSIHPSPLLDLLTSPPHYQSLSAEVMYLPTLALVARGRQLDQRTPPTLQPNHCCDPSAKPSFLPVHTSAKQSFILWTGTFVNKWLTHGLDAKIWLVMCKIY